MSSFVEAAWSLNFARAGGSITGFGFQVDDGQQMAGDARVAPNVNQWRPLWTGERGLLGQLRSIEATAALQGQVSAAPSQRR
jgi:hypothetical protein